jgi:hypothetical protein
VPWSDGFTQSQPTDGAPPSRATAFKIVFDEHSLSVAIRLSHTDPRQIERRPGRRDTTAGDSVYA